MGKIHVTPVPKSSSLVPQNLSRTFVALLTSCLTLTRPFSPNFPAFPSPLRFVGLRGSKDARKGGRD